MQSRESIRVDKWLWAARVFRSRSLATEACNAGHVTILGDRVKPSRAVRVGDVIGVVIAPLQRKVKVIALPDRRVGAKLAGQFIEDLTSPDEYARARQEAQKSPRRLPQGFGRPTRKQRRQLRALTDAL